MQVGLWVACLCMISLCQLVENIPMQWDVCLFIDYVRHRHWGAYALGVHREAIHPLQNCKACGNSLRHQAIRMSLISSRQLRMRQERYSNKAHQNISWQVCHIRLKFHLVLTQNSCMAIKKSNGAFMMLFGASRDVPASTYCVRKGNSMYYG